MEKTFIFTKKVQAKNLHQALKLEPKSHIDSVHMESDDEKLPIGFRASNQNQDE